MPPALTTMRARPQEAITFVCPKCGVDRPGSIIARRQWLSVCRVPVAPLTRVDTAVQCAECGYTSDLGVLDIPTTDQLVDMLTGATIGAAVLVARASSGDQRVAATTRAMAAITDNGVDIDSRRFAHEVATLRRAEAIDRLRLLRHELTNVGKQGFLHRMAAIASSTAPMTARQRDVLRDIGAALGTPAATIDDMVAIASA